MAYADDIIQNSQQYGKNFQAVADDAQTDANQQYDRANLQAGQRNLAAGNYGASIASLANVPGQLPNITGVQDRGNMVQALTAAAGGDRQGAMTAAAATGSAPNVAAAGQTADGQISLKYQMLSRLGNAISQLPEEPGDATGDPTTTRGREVANLAPVFQQMGMPSQAVQQMLTQPRTGSVGHMGPNGQPVPASGTLGAFQQAMTPLLNTTLKGDGGVETAIVNGVPAASGYKAPVAVAPNNKLVDQTTGATMATGVQPPIATAPGTGLRDPVTGAQLGPTQPFEPKALTSGPADSVTAFNPNAPSVGGAGGATRGDTNNNPGNVKSLPNGHMWPGQTGTDAQGFAIFGNPQAGAAAADQNLAAYQHDGAVTPMQIAQRWASTSPPNEIAAKAQAIAAANGVAVNQPLNLSDSSVRAKTLPAIYTTEGTTVGGPAGALTTLKQGGKLTPEQQMKSSQDIQGAEPFKMAQAAMAARQALISNANIMTGPSGYAVLDTFARAINPGAVARPQVIETIAKSLGIANEVVGNWYNLIGQGKLSPAVRQQIIDAVTPFVQAHWDQANALNDHARSIAASTGSDPNMMTAPLGPRPSQFFMTPPPAASRVVGQTYETPKGSFKWTGGGWQPAT